MDVLSKLSDPNEVVFYIQHLISGNRICINFSSIIAIGISGLRVLRKQRGTCYLVRNWGNDSEISLSLKLVNLRCYEKYEDCHKSDIPFNNYFNFLFLSKANIIPSWLHCVNSSRYKLWCDILTNLMSQVFLTFRILIILQINATQ